MAAARAASCSISRRSSASSPRARAAAPLFAGVVRGVSQELEAADKQLVLMMAASGPSHAVVLNAANEVAVASYLAEKISFVSIPRVIEQTMDAHFGIPAVTLEAVREIDRWARRYSQNVARGLELKV